jgi:hypothetical protein
VIPMAKFLMEDGSIKSYDQLVDEYHCGRNEDMTNRLKLINTNMYDLLLKINDKIKNKDGKCILDLIEDKSMPCHCGKSCKECIQDYLNQEN